jgi:hypothetical protein
LRGSCDGRHAAILLRWLRMGLRAISGWVKWRDGRQPAVRGD